VPEVLPAGGALVVFGLLVPVLVPFVLVFAPAPTPLFMPWPLFGTIPP
jgi:hypothetical protein